MAGGKFGEIGKIASHSPIKTSQILKNSHVTYRVVPRVSTTSCHLWFICLLPVCRDPNGPLSAAVPSSTIAAVNKRVSSTIEKYASTNKSQGPYLHLTDEQKDCVGKRVSEFGITNTMRYYLKSFPDLPLLKETSVRRFKNKYERAIKKQLKSGESSSSSVKALPMKPMGRPLLIGEEAD